MRSTGPRSPHGSRTAAEQVLNGQANARPKITTGIIEVLRMIKIPRDAAVKDRTRAYSQLRDLVTTAPAPTVAPSPIERYCSTRAPVPTSTEAATRTPPERLAA